MESSPASTKRMQRREEDSVRDALTSRRGRRVMIAEDDPIARRVLAVALREMGFDVLEIADGGAMLAAVTSYRKNGREPDELDLIITDVHMPVFDGLEVFCGVRAAHWPTPTIIVTADPNLEVRRLATRLGAIVLEKPLDLDVLEAAVRDLLGGAERSTPSAIATG